MTNHKNLNTKAMASLTTEDQIRLVAELIVEAKTDITCDYKRWLNIGFGFSLEMGEAGRDLFHQISQFYSGYKYEECDKQYTACMKRLQTGGKDGITIASFFKYAKDAGISITPSAIERKQQSHQSLTPVTPLGQMGQSGAKQAQGNTAETAMEAEAAKTETAEVALPSFSDKVQSKLPAIFQDIAAQGNTIQQKDMLIFASLVLLSGCFPEVHANYDNRLVYGNLFFFLVAPPASNKGIVSACIKLVAPIEQEIRDYNQREVEEYKQQMAELRANKNKAGIPTPQEPPYRSLFISANSSSTAIYQALADNKGEGITFETEADSLSYALKSDYGNFSDGLRKAFHHERISYTRRTDKEHVNIYAPKWSVLLTGTPGQVTNLIPSCEDGLFSRFIFLLIKREGTWRNVFLKKERTVDEAMTAIGRKIYEIHRLLGQADKKGVKFRLSEKQEKNFNDFFSKLYTEYGSMMGENFDASVLRLGLSCFRIAMVLSIMRLEGTTALPSEIVCTDDDFNAAITIADTLTQHSAHIFTNMMPTLETETIANAKLTELQRKLFEALPDHFTRQQAMALAPKVNMPPKTINKYIGYFVSRFHICQRVRQGEYEKVKTAGNKADSTASHAATTQQSAS